MVVGTINSMYVFVQYISIYTVCVSKKKKVIDRVDRRYPSYDMLVFQKITLCPPPKKDLGSARIARIENKD